MENSLVNENQENQQDKMISGTAWLSAANILSRLLGAIYIIPWYAWMAPHSAQANALFSMGYNVYALFILLSTIGIPAAISKEVSRYNALGDEAMSYRLLRQIMAFMLVIGIVAAIVMYIFSPALSFASGGGENLIPVMRSLALSILFFPIVSVIRGYFQGLNEMKAFAVSQIYEQIIRIIWMLVATFMIMKVGSKNWPLAVTQSTTAAFIGVIASLIVLIFYLIKDNRLTKLLHPRPTKSEIRTSELLKQTIITSIPFLVTGSAIQVFKLVDQMSFINLMLRFTPNSRDELNILFSYFSANVDKITMILIGVALTLGDVGLPLITAAYTKKRRKEVAYLISYNFQLFIAFMLPAVIGVIILARPIYTLFYGIPDALQQDLFIYSTLQSIILTLPILAWIYLQAMHHSRAAMRYFSLTFILKVILQVPSIFLFHTYGPLISTTIALLVGSILSIRKIREITHYNPRILWRRILGIAILSALMGIIVIIIDFLLQLVFHSKGGHLYSFLTVLIAGGVGLYTYLWLTGKIGLLEKLMGSRGTSIRRKLRI